MAFPSTPPCAEAHAVPPPPLKFKLKMSSAAGAEPDLRRWTAPSDLTWTALDAKIRELFALRRAAEMRMTYVDEDGETVTLGCDSDMVELLAQQLATVRVTVVLKEDKRCDEEKLRRKAKDKDKEDRAEHRKEGRRVQDEGKSQDVPSFKGAKGKASAKEIKTSPGDTAVPTKSVEKDSAGGSRGHGAGKGAWLDKCLAKLIWQTEAFQSSPPHGGHRHIEKIMKLLGKCKYKLDAAGEVTIVEFLATTLASNSDLFWVLQTETAASPARHAHAAYLLGQATSHPRSNLTPQEADESVAAEDQVHHGITCDGCNMSPIVGTRFKSLSRHDFDVCKDCYALEGCTWSNDQFLRIERPCHWRLEADVGIFPPPPSPHNHPHFPPPPPLSGGPPPFGCPPPPHHGGYGPGCGFGPGRGWGFGCRRGGRWGGHRGGSHFSHPSTMARLEARFVNDVTMFDGCQVAPGQEGLVKIWKLRNSGQLAWPEGTELLWVGGDSLGAPNSTLLEIPKGGLPPGQELDIAVMLTAPKEPGRYQAYFRLQAPGFCGQRFGQRIWCMLLVTIEGDAKVEEGLQVPAEGREYGVDDDDEVETDTQEVKPTDTTTTEVTVPSAPTMPAPEIEARQHEPKGAQQPDPEEVRMATATAAPAHHFEVATWGNTPDAKATEAESSEAAHAPVVTVSDDVPAPTAIAPANPATEDTCLTSGTSSQSGPARPVGEDHGDEWDWCR